MIVQPTTILPNEAAARALVVQLRADDPDFDYRIAPDPAGSGRCLIEMYADGVLLGKL